MMLEAQFGSEISPIERPRMPTTATKDTTTQEPTKQEEEEEEDDDDKEDEDDEAETAELEAAELARLQALGIPVPGVEIKVDKHVARIWLEDLEVECANAVMRDRVRVVAERAVETVAGMWAEGPPTATAAAAASGGNNSNGLMKGKMDEVDTKA